jgi:hypothetical protein
MKCPSCGQRAAKRRCPALREQICPVCCGTKRQREIDCPPDCIYLTVARQHPAAVVRREHERDVAALVPSIRELTERQQQLFFLFQSAILSHRPTAAGDLSDADVAEAAGAVAATLETAARGVIYEHIPQSLIAQPLAAELSAMPARLREQGATLYDREIAIVLRAIERGARQTSGTLERGEPEKKGDRDYLKLVARLLGPPQWPSQTSDEDQKREEGPKLVLP